MMRASRMLAALSIGLGLLALLSSVRVVAATGSEFRAAKLTDGRFVLVASWSANADRICFYEVGGTTTYGCTTTPVPMQTPTLAVNGQTFTYHRAGGTVGYILVPITTDGVHQIRAYAENTVGRSESSGDLFRIEIRPLPGIPELLNTLDTLIDGAKSTARQLRDQVEKK